MFTKRITNVNKLYTLRTYEFATVIQVSPDPMWHDIALDLYCHPSDVSVYHRPFGKVFAFF